MPKRASEVNGPVSMLTVKSWLELSLASEALSTSAVLKIIFKGKTANDNVKNKRCVQKQRFNQDLDHMELSPS